ncbi:MAG: hypothetical protein H6917_02835 [Novosphingobium sp.]|nr:hypothetical protein [Novosphingobium sp.]MCP5401305.1 hypothetical protein [Novosphingobium sp.]
MRTRLTSILVLIGMFIGVVVMPAISHAGGHIPLHPSEILDIHEVDDADHSHSRGADKDMPCHAVSHHHCSIALQFEAQRVGVNGLSRNALLRPALATRFASRSQAPLLDPPIA